MPHAPYMFRSGSTRTVTGLEGESGWEDDIAFSHVSVEEGVLCETATKWIEGFAAALARRFMNVASATFGIRFSTSPLLIL
jgi:hypothetical protein